MRSPADPPPALDIACLCAAWCRTCDEYAQVFQRLREALPAHRYRWIDVEDEADLVGDVDVETFPTLLVAHQGRVLFLGPVLPRLADAVRLIEALAAAMAAHAGGQAQPVPGVRVMPEADQLAAQALAQALHQAA